MIKRLFTVKLLLFSIAASSQILTYVGDKALVTIQPQTLVYNGGGLQTAGDAVVNNSGNVMINGLSSDLLTLASTASFNVRLTSTSNYGQLYITGIPQVGITGKVNKEYLSDFINGTTGRQQIGLPFFNYTIDELISVFPDLNVTNTTNNSSGRFSLNSAFWWNNARARFDQIARSGSAYDAVGNPNAAFISPLTYYILPRRRANGTYFWVPTTDKRTFRGTPASDMTTSNVQITLAGAYSGGFGVNGNGENFFREKYYSYINDPFELKTPNWAANYGLNLYHVANPFLTNLDLSLIASNEAGNLSDGNNITDIDGIAYYEDGNVNWNISVGSTYPIAAKVLKPVSGVFQVGDVSSTMIKPLGAFMVKLKSNSTSPTLNFNRTRRFKSTPRSSSTNYSVSAAKSSSDNIDESKIVKQVAVVMYDSEGYELDRTYYAVSPSATTGFNTLAKLQAYTGDRRIFTKEEKLSGGLDYNYTEKLYINEANEGDFKSKEIPLYIDYPDAYQLKFEVYEKGERATEGLSNGNSFYLKNAQDQIIKIVDGESLSMSGSQNLGLYYEMPESGTLGTDNLASAYQTIIAKKDNKWVVKFAKNWKKAKVEVYSAAGQLLNVKSEISTDHNYTIPLDYQAKSIFLVRATSESGEVVVKKIIN